MWFAILSSKEVEKDKPIGIVRFGKEIVVWRDENGKVNAIEDLCVHRRARISAGKVVNNRVQCPYHGFEFDGDGRVTFIPSLGRSYKVPEWFSVEAYKVVEKAGIVWMWFGDDEPKGEPKFFQDIDEKFAYTEIRETWNVSFPRAVENQLDVMHLPFVHRTTIGRGNRTLVNGPVVKCLDEDSFKVYTFNEVDRGQIPKKPVEIKQIESNFFLEFIFPNIWQNHISENMRVVAFFVPVTKEKTMIYLRYYIKATGIRSIDMLISKLGMQFNKFVLHQDKGVVETQDKDIIKDRFVQGISRLLSLEKGFTERKNSWNFCSANRY